MTPSVLLLWMRQCLYCKLFHRDTFKCPVYPRQTGRPLTACLLPEDLFPTHSQSFKCTLTNSSGLSSAFCVICPMETHWKASFMQVLHMWKGSLWTSWRLWTPTGLVTHFVRAVVLVNDFSHFPLTEVTAVLGPDQSCTRGCMLVSWSTTCGEHQGLLITWLVSNLWWGVVKLKQLNVSSPWGKLLWQA